MANQEPSGRTRSLRLDVWQFVRLMVQLEETLEKTPGQGKGTAHRALFERWEDIWVDLDARLVDLGQHDMDAFADLMMNQEVVLDDLSQGECRLIGGEMEKVVRTIVFRLKATEDPGDVEDLSFERDELTELIRKL